MEVYVKATLIASCLFVFQHALVVLETRTFCEVRPGLHAALCAILTLTGLTGITVSLVAGVPLAALAHGYTLIVAAGAGIMAYEHKRHLEKERRRYTARRQRGGSEFERVFGFKCAHIDQVRYKKRAAIALGYYAQEVSETAREY